MGFKSPERSFDFSGELAYNDPRQIKGALCQYGDGYENFDLTENDDGMTYVNDRGDVFERQGDIYYLKSKAKPPELLEMERVVREQNPGARDELITVYAKQRLDKQAREQRAAAEAAAKAINKRRKPTKK